MLLAGHDLDMPSLSLSTLREGDHWYRATLTAWWAHGPYPRWPLWPNEPYKHNRRNLTYPDGWWDSWGPSPYLHKREGLCGGGWKPFILPSTPQLQLKLQDPHPPPGAKCLPWEGQSSSLSWTFCSQEKGCFWEELMAKGLFLRRTWPWPNQGYSIHPLVSNF